jgi:hypothetical protein
MKSLNNVPMAIKFQHGLRDPNTPQSLGKKYMLKEMFNLGIFKVDMQSSFNNDLVILPLHDFLNFTCTLKYHFVAIALQ